MSIGSNDTPNTVSSSPVSTGIAGLNDILRGGLTRNRTYLVEGTPGSGKTTLAMQFLLAGASRGEHVLYVTLSESKDELTASAASHGWDLSGIEIIEFIPSEAGLAADDQLTMFHPSEFELSETTAKMLEAVERVQPTRLVLDSLSELRLLAQNALRYRRQILALKQLFKGRNCTVMMLDDRSFGESDLQLHSIAHGVIVLEPLATEFGAERRRLRVTKFRGVGFRGGYHDYLIKPGGLEVYPRLIAAEHHDNFDGDAVRTSGIKALDALLGGGVPVGTSTLLLGPAGTGKSSVAMQFAISAAQRGERTAAFVFDESLGVVQSRAAGLGAPLRQYIDRKLITLQQVDPAELSPGEFANAIRTAVDGADGAAPARVVIIDSLTGYLNAMPEERFLTAQLHELLVYLNQKGVLTMLVVSQIGMMNSAIHSAVDTSYLADNIILFRYFEMNGAVHRAVSVVKKRSGEHESTIRELTMSSPGGIMIGEPLRGLRGVLTGVPTPHDPMQFSTPKTSDE